MLAVGQADAAHCSASLRQTLHSAHEVEDVLAVIQVLHQQHHEVAAEEALELLYAERTSENRFSQQMQTRRTCIAPIIDQIYWRTENVRTDLDLVGHERLAELLATHLCVGWVPLSLALLTRAWLLPGLEQVPLQEHTRLAV